MKQINYILGLLFFWATMAHAGGVVSGGVYRISTTCSGYRTLMVSASSMDLNAKASVWKDTGANSQRWRLTDVGDGSYYIDNAYTLKRLYLQSTSSVAQSTLGATAAYQWVLVPIHQVGYEDCYYITNKSNSQSVLEVVSGTESADGGSLAVATKLATKDPRQIWKIEQAADVPNQLTPAVRTAMMQAWKNKSYNSLKTSFGFWGEAECMEIILDAYETTGREEYKTMFEEVYSRFVSGSGGWTTTKGKNWMWNEFNDDVNWAVLASIRAYFLFGNSTAYNLDYLNIAKTNFDNMYSRALIDVDGLYNLLRWKQSSASLNSCVNGPAIVAACYLAQATGQDIYYQRAKQLYANMRIHLYVPATGRVYDTFSNSWASTYNQGSYLGAAVMLYNRYGDELYKKDAETIVQFIRNNLCNASGVVNVCGDEVDDLPIFKGIMMRYLRRFVVDFGKSGCVDWLQLNALQAYNNRNSDGITWTAWWKKAEEKAYNFLGSFTAVSAAMNAPSDAHTIARKDAFSSIQAGSFNYISKVNSQNNQAGEEMDIVDIQQGAYLGYNFVDFKNRLATGVQFQVANDAQARSVEVRLGSATGMLMGTIEIPASNGVNATVEGQLDKPIDGTKNIYLVFKGNKNGLKLQKFKFTDTNNTYIYTDLTDIRGELTSSHTAAQLTNAINDRLGDEVVFACNTTDRVWLNYESSTPVLLSSYALASGNRDAASNPKSWELQASNNGVDWVELDLQTEQLFDRHCQLKKYSVMTKQAYKYFRLIVSERNGSATELRLSEWQLYGSSIAANDITSDGGVLTAQYVATGVEKAHANLIDKQLATQYKTDKSNFWIQYKAQARYKLTSYSISVGNGAPESDPKSWLLYGSVNGSTWYVIDSLTDQEFGTRNSTQTYSCNAATGYNRFKINVVSNHGDPYSGVAEWQLFGDLYFDPFYHDFTKSGGQLSSSLDDADLTLRPLTDNNASTLYTANATILPVWVQYESPVSVAIQAYSITFGGDASTDPKSWKLQGSSDGVTWSDIDTKTNIIIDTRYAQKRYTTASNHMFAKFRLLITAANSGEVAIADWQIYGLALNSYDITSNPGGALSTQWPGKNDANSTGKLIDKSKDTKYYNEGRASFWAIYKSARPAKLTAYSLTSANDYAGRDPREWIVYGSNDSISWAVLDHQQYPLFPLRQTSQYYLVHTNVKYKYFKLHVLDNLGERGVQLAEWQLYGEFNDYTADITENGGVLTTSHPATNQTREAALIDNSETSRYYLSISSTLLANGVWFKYESPVAVALSSYTLTASNDNPSNDPAVWVLQGSNDNTNWTDIDHRSAISFDRRCERKRFDVTSAPYKFFRIMITATKTVSAALQLSEWELFGTPVSGINQIESDVRLTVSPNPASDFVSVDMPDDGLLTIHSVAGALLLTDKVQKGSHKIAVGAYPQGAYLVRVESKRAVQSKLLIKK